MHIHDFILCPFLWDFVVDLYDWAYLIKKYYMAM